MPISQRVGPFLGGLYTSEFKLMVLPTFIHIITKLLSNAIKLYFKLDNSNLINNSKSDQSDFIRDVIS
jgi:hypothetical protein